ncbi:MAG: ABC transporter permease [Sporolactobacillus sp.]
MDTFKQFFKYRETIVGIIVAFVFMLVFFCVWTTGYHGVTNRTDHLRIGLVNSDQQLGNTIKNELKKNLPFKVKIYKQIHTAKRAMKNRQLDMIVSIPRNFSSNLQQRKHPQITYFINQANASLAKQVMNNAAKNITQNVNDKIYSYQRALVINNLSHQLPQQIAQKEIAQKLTANLSRALQSVRVTAVKSNIVQPNEAKDFSVTMIPLLVLLASFVGSMIMSLNLATVSEKINRSFRKWPIFFSKQVINIGMSLILALSTLILMKLFGVDFKTSIFETGLFELLVYFAFLCFTQMMLILFGPAGMLINIISLSVQLVTSGVLVPKVMLSQFYQSISDYFPASYIADGYLTVLFGGRDLVDDLLLLSLISSITFLGSLVRVCFQKEQSISMEQSN